MLIMMVIWDVLAGTFNIALLTVVYTLHYVPIIMYSEKYDMSSVYSTMN